MGISHPTRVGGFISASDSDSISGDLSVDGLPIGTKVFNQDVGAFFTLTLSTASLVTDEVLEVLGITGARWIVDPAGVESVTTDATLSGDGTEGDPLSVVSAPTADAPTNATSFTAALNVATVSLKGLMSSDDKAQQGQIGANLTDSDQTITPGADKCSVYFLRANTLTAGRVITISDAGCALGDFFTVVIQQTTGNFNSQFNDAAASPIKTFNCGTNAHAIAYSFYFGGTHWVYSSSKWV